MADDEELSETEGGADPWRRGWAGIGALAAALLLVALIVMVTLSNRARDRALAEERQSYEIMHLARGADASLARAEAALGRFVLDEEQTTGTSFSEQWQLAGRHIAGLREIVDDPGQRRRIDKLAELYTVRGEEFAAAARGASARQGSGGVLAFFEAGRSRTGAEIRNLLQDIVASEQARLGERMEETSMFSDESAQLTAWLAGLGLLLGIGAIVLGWAAWSAMKEHHRARLDADYEAFRAGALEAAVEERTRELKETNERLRQVQKMEAVGQLTGGIAHDFNNMLAVAVGGLDLALRKLGRRDREVRTHLRNALEGANRAAALTRRLLAFARAEPLLPAAISPRALIEGMRELIDRTIGEPIAVETSFPREDWPVWVDPHQLENALLNLAVNARDAMEGEGRLAIAVENVVLGEGEIGALPAGDYVRIAVSDSGCGMSREVQERVFEPFFTTKPAGKGTGLGLSQIFAFARQSGGEVAIDSAPGKGTCVSLFLPRSAEAAAAPDVGGQEAPEPVRASRAGTILVVEDDPRVARATANALAELGFELLVAESGAEALDILAGRSDVSLVLTDVVMPEMTGPELVRIVEREHPGVASLFLTGYVGEAGDAEELGGHDILRKPFTLAELSQAVNGVLARQAADEALRRGAAAG
ncbi:MAG: ATP-binding protein [Sphingomonadaceae bacterium]